MTTPFFDPASHERLVIWLAWILLHAVWQGAVIASLLWLTLRVIRTSSVRYVLACGALLAIALCMTVTGFTLRASLRTQPRLADAAHASSKIDDRQIASPHHRVDESRADRNAINPDKDDQTPSMSSRVPPVENRQDRTDNPAAAFSIRATVGESLQAFRQFIDAYAGLLVSAWLLGIAVCMVRLLSSLRAVRVLRKTGTPISDARLSPLFSALIQRLNLDPAVRLMQSASVCVPTALGWFRPVVLFPMALSTSLSIDQIEALLAHELAHIKRYDYLINLLQSFVEMVLFYHPAVWWISKTIRNERECCCDAIAVRLVSNRDLYAKTLVELARLATGPTQLAMSATRGNLKDRIQRILNVPTSESATSAPVIALTMAFLLTFVFAASWLSKAGADDAKTEKPAPARSSDRKNDDKKDDQLPPPADAKGDKSDANTATPGDAPDKPRLVERQRRNPNGEGFGGAEVFNLLELDAVQKELGLNEDAMTRTKAVAEQYKKEIQPALPSDAVRTRRVEWGIRQEATGKGMAVFKAVVVRFRPQLKDILTPDQYTRLQQIKWQDMGTAAFADDELIEILKITKEQQDKIVAIQDAYRTKRLELEDQSGGRDAPLMTARQTQELTVEQDMKITESLSQELKDKFAALKGKAIDRTLLRPRMPPRFGVILSGPAASFLTLIENEAVVNELAVDTETASKIQTLLEEWHKSLVEPNQRKRDEEPKPAEKEPDPLPTSIRAGNVAATEKSLAKLKEILSADQWTRLQQIQWQQMGTNALSDPEMIKALPLSKDLQDKIAEIRKEYEGKRSKVIQRQFASQTAATDLDLKQDAEVDEVLTTDQLNQFTALLGKEFDVRQARMERARSQALVNRNLPPRRREDVPDAFTISRMRSAVKGLARDPNGLRIERRDHRRPLFALAENAAVQKDLEVDEGTATRIKTLADAVRAAVREAAGEIPNFEPMSREEREKQRDRLKEIDQVVSENFLPMLKQILTADQFVRLKQIYWQIGGPLPRDSELLEDLMLSRDQRARLHAIESDYKEQRDEITFNATIDTISVSIVRPVPMIATPEEVQRAFNQFVAKIDEVLTNEQRETLASLKGKEFDVRLLVR